MKKHLDLAHSEVMKEVEGSKSRISKRYKMQTQVCMQLTEQVERDYKKISDRINENSEVMKESYAKIISEVQASTSHAMFLRKLRIEHSWRRCVSCKGISGSAIAELNKDWKTKAWEHQAAILESILWS